LDQTMSFLSTQVHQGIIPVCTNVAPFKLSSLPKVSVSRGVDPETGESMSKMDRIALCDVREISPGDPLFCELNRRDDQVWAAARSRHPGGVNASMCDASVRFVADSIDLLVWRAMATRDGGEAVSGLE